jgi:hypothetical protein
VAFKKLIQCPGCKFTNRLGDPRCLICKEPLPQVEAVAAAAPAPIGKTASSPKPAAGKSPVRPEENTEPRGRAKADGIDARATAAQRRVAIDEDPTGPRGQEGRDAIERAKPTSRISAAEVIDRAKIIAWLCCDPLPPIPLGPKPLLSIGRQAECDLVLPHKEVSRRHAVVKIRGTNMVLEDEGSSNGCYVNGTRASGQVLKVGDTITIGPYEVEIRSKDDVEKPKDGADTTSNLELTTVSRLSPLAAMTGKLEEVPLMELLQGIEFNKKTGTLTVDAGKERGQLVVSEGSPICARWGTTLKDDDAVHRMLSLLKGRFTFAGAVEPGERTMRSSITHILLEASRRIDEGETAQRDDGAAAAPDAVSKVPEEAAGADGQSGWTLEDG